MSKRLIAETVALLSDTANHQILAKKLGFVAVRLVALDGDKRSTLATTVETRALAQTTRAHLLTR